MSSESATMASERKWVEDTVAAIMAEVELQADLTAAFVKRQGMRPVDSPGDTPGCNQVELSGANTQFLLGLGAALRIESWEQTGLKPMLPSDLPASADALMAATAALLPDCQASRDPNIAMKVFLVWLSMFSRCGRNTIGCEIVLPASGNAKNLIDELVDFLWRNRTVGDGKDKL